MKPSSSELWTERFCRAYSVQKSVSGDLQPRGNRKLNMRPLLKPLLALIILSLMLRNVVLVEGQDATSLSQGIEMATKSFQDLARHVMLQQTHMEEKIRSDGDSGIKLVRGHTKGLENYHSKSHMGGSYIAMHDHSNFDRTIGMGELELAINGVEFRTRHNDYKMVMASTTSTEFDALEDIPFPEVPPKVLAQTTLRGQIEEMKEYFKAFYNQDSKLRKYKKYFKANLCYMEGLWTIPGERIDEPFASDRHHIDARSWIDLQEKSRLTSYTGAKDRLENFAYLPTAIMFMNESTGFPVYGQWNYRILCHPIKRDIPFRYLKQDTDMKYRMSMKMDKEKVIHTRAARFKLYEGDDENYQLLDELFAEIPGKDNLPNDLQQVTFGKGSLYSGGHQDDVVLNTGYYHHRYRFYKGMVNNSRGFSDANLWVAQTTQSKVAPMKITECKETDVNGQMQTVCETAYNRFTYAIPLEIVYMTPLLSWNPYNLTFHTKGGIVTKGGRNGRNTTQKAYDGIDKRRFYMTPVQFFKGELDDSDPADTVVNAVTVLDPERKKRQVSTSGTRVFMQAFNLDIGEIRLRYPIAPVYGEGSSEWKELNALKDVMENYGEPEGAPEFVYFKMSMTVRDPPGEHDHDFAIPYDQYLDMVVNRVGAHVTTTLNQGHQHNLIIKYIRPKRLYRYVLCDQVKRCKDKHPNPTILLTNNVYTNVDHLLG